MKQIFDVFLESKLPTVDWNSFENLRDGDCHNFVFHIEIMTDKNLIAPAGNTGMGIVRTLEGDYSTSIIPWRLTSDGHDFANALAKPSILERIQTSFKKEGISTVISISKKLIEKQISKLIEE